MNITRHTIYQWLINCHHIFTAQQDYLTQLDREIGDADHGLNMQRGFNYVVEKLPDVANKDIGTILRTVGMTLLSKVGGASGPLFGTFFLKAAQVAQNKEILTLNEFYDVLKAGSDGLIARGRAELGDKTICDVLIPVLHDFQLALDKHENSPALFQCLADTAEHAAHDTTPLIAKKGRASYLHERSCGHQDPGATSTSYIFKALAQTMENCHD
ncbi:dihydroxyacetone kinase [Actinobacillus delphinicola]|uniref:Dihydroxyacetone kinase subunit DhaL n=1 Tax=Actinobacillus delphinicola TaxID=51161 RepID=A0A448TT89_9PAST|nr:dihydroxyacetone kinase subunit DhaL [Actinobacillus delphinicola]MDG6897546.1 dihydroxyacetone kinase [Actinobacillus delphinicola]VEJ09230.1 dihydroxyacetone kinase subunit DhaL [Actinobacillus delphinicola]